jgi:hypothetical protein
MWLAISRFQRFVSQLFRSGTTPAEEEEEWSRYGVNNALSATIATGGLQQAPEKKPAEGSE